MTRLFAISLLALLATALPSHAFIGGWWDALFGPDPEDIPVEVQNREALPLYEEAQRLQAEGREGRALERYERIWKRYPVSRYAADALYQTGIIEQGYRDWGDAFLAYQRIIILYPEYPRFNEIIDRQKHIATLLWTTRAGRLLWFIPVKNYDRAVRYYEIILRNAPYREDSPEILMNIARIHIIKDQVPETIDALDRIINNYPASPQAQDAYLLLAETYADQVAGPEYDQGSTREAISYFEDFLILYPDSAQVREAERGLAQTRDIFARSKLVMGEFYYHYRGNYRAAEVFFNEAITIDPDSPAAARAGAYLDAVEQMKQRAIATGEPMPLPNFWTQLFFWRSPNIPQVSYAEYPLPNYRRDRGVDKDELDIPAAPTSELDVPALEKESRHPISRARR